MAIAGETLLYLSRAGMMAYSGGIPQPVGEAFGMDRMRDAVAGSDGLKYYLSAQTGDRGWLLHVYDTRRGLWHTEDATRATNFALCGGNLYFLNDAGEIWITGNITDHPGSAEIQGGEWEAPVAWEVEFGDFTEGNPNKKKVAKIQIRLELDPGATAEVLMQFDTDGQWISAGGVLAENVKCSRYLPIIPRRGDHYRMKIRGTGGCRVYSLTREYSSGSELKSTRGRQ